MFFGVVDCYNHEIDYSSQASFGVDELLKNKAYRKQWKSSGNALSISTGELAGLVKGFDSAYCVNKSPFTNRLSVSEFKGLGETLAKAGLSGLRFERKSEKPVILLLNNDKTESLEVSDSFAKSLWSKGGHAAVRYYCLKNSGKFFEEKPVVVTTSLGSGTVFGNAKEKFSTESGGVGSVLYQSHGALAVCLSQNNKVTSLDEELVNALRGEFAFNSLGVPDWKLLFNQKYENLPYRVVWGFEEDVKRTGLLLGIFDGDLAEKFHSKISVQGFDAAEVSNLIAGFIHAVHAGRVWREDFSKDFDVCFDFAEFNKNPTYYSREHYDFSVEMLSLLSNNLNISRSRLFEHLKERYGKHALNYFNPVEGIDLRRAVAGSNSSFEWNASFTGKLCALKNGRTRDYGLEAFKLKKRIDKFNKSGKVFKKIFEH